MDSSGMFCWNSSSKFLLEHGVPIETRTTKVEHKAPGMYGWEYVWLEIFVVWLCFNGSSKSN